MQTPAPGPAAPVKIGAGGVKINWMAIIVAIALTILTIWVVSKFVTNEIYDTNGNKTGEIKPRFGMPSMSKKTEKTA